MKILLALDSFKNSFDSIQINTLVKSILLERCPSATIELCPIADGGEGSADIMRFHLGGKWESSTVCDPLFRNIQAPFLYMPNEKMAFIEMAKASGLELLKNTEIDCLRTSSMGTGQLIKAAINLGAKKIYLFIGGSATNDLGLGMASALGYDFYIRNQVMDKLTGETLILIDSYSKSQDAAIIDNIDFTVLCDVENPLLGPNGAAHVYAAQKGANPEGINLLEEGAASFLKCNNNNDSVRIAEIPGAGAAGGMGFGAMLFLNAKINSGADFIFDKIKFGEKLESCDMVITGEGKIDSQTLFGKLISRVASIAGHKHIPVIAISAISTLTKEEYSTRNIENIYTLYKDSPSKISIQDSTYRLGKIVNQIVQDYLV